jgi:hypothetical protein
LIRITDNINAFEKQENWSVQNKTVVTERGSLYWNGKYIIGFSLCCSGLIAESFDRLGRKANGSSLCGQAREILFIRISRFLGSSRHYYHGILDWYFFLFLLFMTLTVPESCKEIRQSGGNSGLVGICFTDEFLCDNLPVNFLPGF